MGQVSHSFVLSVLHAFVLECLEIMVDGMADDDLVFQDSMGILLCLRERYRSITLFEMGRGDAAHPSSEVCDSPCWSYILVVQHVAVVVDYGHPKPMVTLLEEAYLASASLLFSTPTISQSTATIGVSPLNVVCEGENIWFTISFLSIDAEIATALS